MMSRRAAQACSVGRLQRAGGAAAGWAGAALLRAAMVMHTQGVGRQAGPWAVGQGMGFVLHCCWLARSSAAIAAACLC